MDQQKIVISTLNKVSEKVDFCVRKIHMSNASSGQVACKDVPTLPEGLELPVDSTRSIRDMSARLAYDAGLRKRLVTCYLFQIISVKEKPIKTQFLL